MSRPIISLFAAEERAVKRDVGAAARAVARVMAQPVTPCALEFIDDVALKLARDYAPDAGVPEAGALLMIEVDGEPDPCPPPPKPWRARKALSPATKTWWCR